MTHLENIGRKKWRITIELGTDPKTGKRKRKYKTVSGTKKEAEKIKIKLIQKYKNGPIKIDEKINLKKYLRQWLKEKKNEVSPNTYPSYVTIVEKHLNPKLGYAKLKDLEKHPYLIKEYISEKRENGKLLGPGGLSEQTLRHHFNVLNNALKQAKGLGYIKTNPCQNEAINKPIPDPEAVKPFEEQEIPILLKNFKRENNWLYNIVLLDIMTGLRRGEIAGLQWKNVDLQNNKIYVRKSAYRAKKEGIQYKKPKTKSSIRAINISRQSTKLLKKLRKYQLKQTESINFKDNLVFPMPNGERTDPDYITKCFKSAIKNSQFDNKHTFHDLRHTHASILLKKGVTMKALQERLGHSSIQVTIDIYSHLVPTIQKKAAEKIDEIINK